MTDLWNNIIYESSLTEKILEYYENKVKEKKELKTEKNEEENKD
jgi:hypothetical protein